MANYCGVALGVCRSGLLAALMLVNGVSAQAASFGVSYSGIRNLDFSIGSFGGDSAYDNTVSLSSASVSARSVQDIQPLDATVSLVGNGAPTIVNNQMSPVLGGGQYGFSDSAIYNSSDAIAAPITLGDSHNRSIAEIYAGDGAVNGSALSGASLNFSFNLSSGAAGVIAFNADPYLNVMLDDATSAGSTVEALLNAQLSIADASGNEVFLWTPDGSSGGISGGIEFMDPYDLNRRITSSGPNQSQIYDPTGDASFGASSSGNTFWAMTNTLAAGSYTAAFNFGAAVSASVTPAFEATEPGLLILFGLGGICLLYARRLLPR